MKRALAFLSILLACGALLLAEAPPAPEDINSPVHEVIRLRLVSSFQRALLAQQVKLRADADFDAARNDYTSLADATAAELKLPKGSEFVIGPKGEVQVKMPPPAPPAPALAPAKPINSVPAPEAPKQ